MYITGRNETTLGECATELGVNAIPVVCDHSDDVAIEQLFKKIDADNDGRIDLLVNNCYAAVTTLLGKESDKAVNKFWEQDPLIWDKVRNLNRLHTFNSDLLIGKSCGSSCKLYCFGLCCQINGTTRRRNNSQHVLTRGSYISL